MKQVILSISCCLAGISFWVCTIEAATPGSIRPVVQKNFRQLIDTNSCPGCDLAGVVLTRVNLAGADLAGANLAGAKLYLADLSGANLTDANLQGAALGGADLAGANLKGANLTGAVLEGAYLKGAITDGIITNRLIPGANVGVGEKVIEVAESKSKHSPYSQEVVVEERKDFEDSPPAIEPVKEKTVAQTVPEQGEVTAPVLAQSKQPVQMADAVVPSVTPEPVVEEQEVVLEKQSKQKVVPVDVPEPEVAREVAEQKEEVVELIEADITEKKQLPATKKEDIPAQEQEKVTTAVDENSAVYDMIAQIEADSDKPTTQPEDVKQQAPQEVVPAAESTVEAVTQPAEEKVADDQVALKPAKEELSTPQALPPVEKEKAPEQEGAISRTEGEATEESVEAATLQAQSPDRQEAAETAGEKKVEDAESDESVRAMVAGIEKETEAEPPVDSLLYTVETPEQAAAKQQALIDLLLDDDRCVECDLSGVDLSGKRLKAVDLERANLQSANLEDVNLSEANLKAANLSGANLRNADLSEADLYRADLTGADLTGADLTETLIDSADFTGAIGFSTPETEETLQD